MEKELQEMRSLVAQLKADNERLRREQVLTQPEPMAGPSSDVTSDSPPTASGPVTERLIFIPRDRRCPTFSGMSNLSLDEWLEEVQACSRARHLSGSEQAFFMFDHLEGEARAEIKFRPNAEKSDPAKITSVLRELYGCSQSYVLLQEAFFSRKQQDGESLLEFSLALMSLMERVKRQSPCRMTNAESLLRDQFTEHVWDSLLRRELKKWVRGHPDSTLLDVRREAMRWEQEGLQGGTRGRSSSVPLINGTQYGVQGGSQQITHTRPMSEIGELKELIRSQQEQLNELTRNVGLLQKSHQQNREPRNRQIVCRHCGQTGHFARECDGVRISQPSSQLGKAKPPASEN
ncbi:uncharacterized protein LOC112140891 [Oryzias melastigma]|uniref:uncharacterized protein LOC112140891 n=1 Tax=Oryzias melastigma TaxID=30732 RepID=UPI00168D75AF|nr:uncharacterized protein LOC112140891 [Oryzias melastigma]